MLMAKLDNGVCIFGITRENVDRLVNGEPIFQSLADIGHIDNAIILYGETLEDVRHTIEQATGQNLPSIDEIVAQGQTKQ